jgi:hypothetical protein
LAWPKNAARMIGRALADMAFADEDILVAERTVYAHLVTSLPAERVVSIGFHQACSFSIRDVILKAESTGASAPLPWQG